MVCVCIFHDSLCIHGCQTEDLNKQMCYQSLWTVSVYFRILSVFMAVKQRFQTNRCGTKVYGLCLYISGFFLYAWLSNRCGTKVYGLCLYISGFFLYAWLSNRCGTKVYGLCLYISGFFLYAWLSNRGFKQTDVVPKFMVCVCIFQDSLCIHGCQTEVSNKQMWYQSLWSVSVYFRILSVFMAVKQRFQTNRCGTKVYGLCLYISGFFLYAWLSNRCGTKVYGLCLYISGFFLYAWLSNRCGTKVYGLCLYISGFFLYAWLSNRGFKQTDVVPKFMVCVCIFQDSLCIHGCQTEVSNKQMCYQSLWTVSVYFRILSVFMAVKQRFQTNTCVTKVYGLCLYISGFSLYSWLSNRGFKQTDVLPKFMVCVCIFQDSLCIHGCQTEVSNKQMWYQSLWSVSVYFRILSVFMAVKHRFQTNRCGTKVYGLCLYISGFSLYSWLSNRGFKQTHVLPKFMVCVCIFQDSLCIHGCQAEVSNKQMCYQSSCCINCMKKQT